MRDKFGRFIKSHAVPDKWRHGVALTHTGNTYRRGSTHTEEAKEKNRIAHLGKVAWNKGKRLKYRPHLSQRGKLVGEKNNLWKGGISKITRKERTNFMDTLEYKNWRRNIFKRDDYTCQICGKRGGELRANHIKKYADHPNLRIDDNNGITICRDCDIRWVLRHEEEWESYFNFNLLTYGTDTYDGFIVGQNV